MDTEWTKYKCESGEVIFRLYIKTTEEDKLPELPFPEVSISKKDYCVTLLLFSWFKVNNYQSRDSNHGPQQ